MNNNGKDGISIYLHAIFTFLDTSICTNLFVKLNCKVFLGHLNVHCNVVHNVCTTFLTDLRLCHINSQRFLNQNPTFLQRCYNVDLFAGWPVEEKLPWIL